MFRRGAFVYTTLAGAVRLRQVLQWADVLALPFYHTVSDTSPQARYVNALLAELPSARMQPYLRLAKGDTRRALAYYHWNVEACRAFYPALQTLEITLRNALDYRIGQVIVHNRLLDGRTHHPDVQSWLTVTKSLIAHPGAQVTVAQAVHDIVPYDSTGKVRPHRKNHGDLVAKLPFGFWTSLLADEYGAAATQPVDLAWHDEAKHLVFPGATGISMPDINTRFKHIRHFRNRVFHHEPIWSKPTPLDKPVAVNTHPEINDAYADIMTALRYLGGPHAQLAPVLHGRPTEFDMPPSVEKMEARLDAAVEVLLARAAARAAKKARKKTGKGGEAATV